MSISIQIRTHRLFFDDSICRVTVASNANDGSRIAATEVPLLISSAIVLAVKDLETLDHRICEGELSGSFLDNCSAFLSIADVHHLITFAENSDPHSASHYIIPGTFSELPFRILDLARAR